MINQRSPTDNQKTELVLHLLGFIKSRLNEEINKCKLISDKQTELAQRQVNIAGFCVKFLGEISKEKESYQLALKGGDHE